MTARPAEAEAMLSRLAPPPADESGDPRRLMGYISGWMYIGVGSIALAGVAVPALRFHPAWQIGLALAAIVNGVLNVLDVQHWGRRSMRVHVMAMAAALPVIGVAVWATGGDQSYIVPLLLLAPTHWAFFLDRERVVLALCSGLAAAVWAPSFYEAGALTGAALGRMATGMAAIFFIAGALMLIRRRLRSTEQRLRELTNLDPLTGLLNRRGFETAMRHVVARPDALTRPLLVLLDLDHLKHFNDLHGHTLGDEALQTFARHLRAAIRPQDRAARVGGDEFAVIGRVRDERAAELIATRLRDAVDAELSVPGARVAATLGWALGPHTVDDVDGASRALMDVADQRLLDSKRRRKLLTVA